MTELLNGSSEEFYHDAGGINSDPFKEAVVEDEGADYDALEDEFVLDTTGNEGFTRDSVRQYLREIGRYPLLTKNDEIELAKDMERGREAQVKLDYLQAGPKRASRYADRISQLELQSNFGLQARQQMINSNLRLVVSVAKAPKYKGRGLALMDLVQEGTKGLILAVDKFDHTRGYRFSTPAVWWIRQAVERGLQTYSDTITLPEDVAKNKRVVYALQGVLMAKHGREPTVDEISHETGISAEEVHDVFSAAQVVTSLDRSLGDEEGENFGSLHPDDNAIDPFEETEAIIRSEQINIAVNRLPAEQRDVIKMYFGLDAQPMPLPEIAEKLGRPLSAVVKIRDKSLISLRGYYEIQRHAPEHNGQSTEISQAA